MLLGLDLSVWWFWIVLLCIIGYACLDGFDLGVGILHFFTKEDYERRVFLNAIGPVWDGNAVWLIIVVGALFAGFPGAYATIMSAFYTPVTVFIAGLILRAVAIEFRSKQKGFAWRELWDKVFSLGSLIIAFGVGLLLGNMTQGIALDQDHNFTGHVMDLLTPYTALVGVMTVACFTLHGCLFLLMKTEGEIHKKLRLWVLPCIVFFVLIYFLTTMTTLIYQPHMVDRLRDEPYLFLFALFSLLAVANIPRLVFKGRDGWAFLNSCLSIALMMVLYGLGIFPTLMRSTVNTAVNSVTIENAGSSDMTFKVLLLIVAIGVPLVIIYGFIVYRTFRGKVRIDRHSY